MHDAERRRKAFAGPSLVFDHDLEFGNEYQRFYDQSPRTLELFRGTFLDISGIVTHHFDAVDYQQAFEVVNRGECGKVILDWTDV